MLKENHRRHYLLDLFIISFITLCTYGFLAHAEERSSKDLIIEELKLHLEQMNDFTATFVQEKHISLFNSAIVSSGLIKWKKPNLLFISIDSPDSSKLFLNGNILWMYYPDERVAEKFSLKENKNLTNSFFMFTMLNNLIERNYAQTITIQADTVALDLNPLGSAFKAIKLCFSKKNWLLKRIEMLEKDGDSTVVIFSNITINSNIPDETFTFTPPQGVIISSINESLPSW